MRVRRLMRRPEILLINPWIHDFAAYDLWARPMGLLVLASRLRRLGWEPRLVDCLDRDHPAVKEVRAKPLGHGKFFRATIPKPEALADFPRRYSRYGVPPDLIAKDLEAMSNVKAILVTGLMTYWYGGVREAVSLAKERLPGTPVILGGVYASIMSEHAGKVSGADIVIPGPGEETLPQALFDMTGLAPRGESASCPVEFEPALDLMRKVRFAPILTSRGCPFSCSYCASKRVSPRFTQRDPREVVKELEQAHVKHGIVDVVLYDDAFLVNAQNHALPLLEEVTRRIPGLRWHTPNGLHASAIDSKVAQTLKRADFTTIRLGLESASDSFHRKTGGKTDREAFAQAVRNLRDAGFDHQSIGAYLLVGLPGQTRQEVERDVEFALGCGALPKLAEFSPIPGAAMWDAALKASRLPIDVEPLFQNCTLLPTADPEIDWRFLQETRRHIRDEVESWRGFGNNRDNFQGPLG